MSKHLIQQLVTILHESLRSKGLISESAFINYQVIMQSTAVESHEALQKVVSLLQEMPVREVQDISRLVALETIVLNAVNNYEHAISSRSPKQRFLDIFVRVVQHGSASEAIDRLLETKQKMIVSLTHTMHPTIYHTPEARGLEAEISRSLEEKFIFAKDSERSDQFSMSIFEDILNDFLDNMRKNHVAITPQRAVTLPQEAMTERENMKAITIYIDDVVREWNEAVDEFALSHDASTSLKLRGLRMSDAEKRKVFQLRTWGQGGDADGRERATSTQLYRTIYHSGYLDDSDQYVGPVLDLRQNAEMHTNLVSALIQVKFRDSAGSHTLPSADGRRFETYCKKYIESINTPDDWRSTSESIYQELRGHKADCVRTLIVSDFMLLPEHLKESAIAFNQMYGPLFEQFLQEYALSPDTTFDDLKHCNDPYDYAMRFPNLQRKLRQQVKNEEVIVHVNGKKNYFHFFLNDSGLQYQQDNYELGRDYLQDRVALDADGNHRQLSIEERATLMDLVKRLVVINHAIDEFGEVVANRHQIANFASKAHFYETMLLFKEAGLVTIDSEKQCVIEVKMGIQPLLETLEDLRAAPQIFRELLQDPLVRSYYEKRGVAELMLGFSDGAKSAGNFASQWEIYKAAEELTEVFAAYNITTRFFEGRGRGIDRGGSIEAGVTRNLMPDNVVVSAIDDRTIQADLPMDMAASPFYGRDQLASMLVGIIAGREVALTRSDVERAMLKSHVPALDYIARLSSYYFQHDVRENPDASTFLFSMPQNPDISSRKSKRMGTAKQNYEAVRAIRNEYAANFADLPYNHVGFKKALEMFVSGADASIEEDGKSVVLSARDIAVLNEKGESVSGKKALEALIHHPFFSTFLEVAGIGLSHYNPAVADAYAEKTGTQSFVAKVEEHLTGLKNMIADLLGHEIQERGHTETGARLKALDMVAHAMIHSLDNMNPNQKQFPIETEIIRNALFVNAAEISHKEPSSAIRSFDQVMLN